MENTIVELVRLMYKVILVAPKFKIWNSFPELITTFMPCPRTLHYMSIFHHGSCEHTLNPFGLNLNPKKLYCHVIW